MLPVKRKRSLTFLESLAPSFTVYRVTCLAKYLTCVNSIQSHLLGPVQPVFCLYPCRPSAHQPREVNQSDGPQCEKDEKDRCEKDVKNSRPHSLKPEEGLLTIDKDFLSLSVFILDQRGQNHKDNEKAGSLYMKQFTS